MRILTAFVLTLAGAALILAAPSDPEGLVVHEWGTFLAMNGSDGVSLDGMYHEEHALPTFVHARSRDQLRLPMSLLKNETPVVYFYAAQPQRVQVEVQFPTGLWTQWYPQAVMVAPGLVQAGSPPRTRNGRIAWDVDVVPPDRVAARLPAAASDALWNHARNVDAAFVSPADPSDAVYRSPRREWERFIFYRGLGEAPLPIEVRSDGAHVTATTKADNALRHVFVVRIENGRGAYAYTPAIASRSPLHQSLPTMHAALPLDTFADKIADDMAERLVESGLYPKEARAMVNTWRGSYFNTDGVRVLFVLPRSWTDQFIPMQIKPAPAQLVRVMVGRVELLDPSRERRAEIAIGDLSSRDSGVRERAFDTLQREGRYVEPIVRRTLRATTDEHVRALSQRLLLTDFVTELRTALTDASTGERVTVEPAYLRAQLASLLREVGLTQEAKQEGEDALRELAKLPPPSMGNHTSRNAYRALARAHEGAGHDADALKWYGEFVRFGSQVPAGARACTGCHVTLGPRDASFFRDWYAGKKYAEYATKTGQARALIAAHEATLAASPHNVAAEMSLAYLYEATGNGKRADDLWARLER